MENSELWKYYPYLHEDFLIGEKELAKIEPNKYCLFYLQYDEILLETFPTWEEVKKFIIALILEKDETSRGTPLELFYNQRKIIIKIDILQSEKYDETTWNSYGE
jgi:hypothetical protein